MSLLRLFLMAVLVVPCSSAFAQWSTSGSNVYYNGGNVGIGTSSPGGKLEVTGDAYVNGHTVGRGNGNISTNLVLGTQALSSNVAGNTNVVLGNQAMWFASNAVANVAIGTEALRDATYGSQNVAIGHYTMKSNTTGDRNIAIGSYAYGNGEADGNISIGYSSMIVNTRGSYNIVIGESTFNDYSPSSAVDAYNTVIGYQTGRGIVSGTNNTILGSNVSGLASSLSNNIIIADGAGNQRINVGSSGNVGLGVAAPSTKLQVAGVITPSADNTYDLGSSSLRFKDVYATNGTIQTSDAREKKEIQVSDLGLNFINSLRPVSYKWKKGDSDTHYGLIAQETEKVLQQFRSQNYSSGTIVSVDKTSGRYGVRYSELIAPIIKSVQELSVSCESNNNDYKSLKTAYAGVKQQNAELAGRVEKLEKLVAEHFSK